MANRAVIIRDRNSARWDDLVRSAAQGGHVGTEHDYFGITGPDRADKVRRALRTAAKHQGYGAKVFYSECPAPGRCDNGGPDCAYHVYWTLYPMEEARRYKAQQAGGSR